MRVSFWITIIVMSVSSIGCAAAAKAQKVDFLDYFLQTDDVGEHWTIGGTDVRPAPDPDGTGMRTYVLSKFSDPNCYEVYKVTDDQVQIRYEVVRHSEAKKNTWWIRRYREIDGKGPAPGAVWTPRYVTPGGKGYLSRFNQDRFVFDDRTHAYVRKARGSTRDFTNYLSCVWAHEHWNGNNLTGFDLDHVLRLIAQWQRDGAIFEEYDYAKGKGLVNWRWLERISTLNPVKADKTGHLFHCEETNFVWIDKSEPKPRAWKWDPKTHQRARELEVVKFKSYWKPKLGKQWYVVYRDLSQEGKLVKRMERAKIDYHLPEWTAHPGATIADLPAVFTK